MTPSKPEGTERAALGGLDWPVERRAVAEELIEIYTRDSAVYAQARRERFATVRQHTGLDVLGSVLASIALAVFLYRPEIASTVWLWLVAVNAMPALRLYLSRSSARGAVDPDHELQINRLFALSLVIGGGAWMAAFFLLTEPGALPQRASVAIWLVGSSAWVVSAYSLVLEAVLGLLFVQMIPIAVHLFFSGEPVQQLFAIGATVFVPCMSLIAIRNNILLMRGAITELERRELVSQLEEERQAVVTLNRELEQDIERRRLVESDLREAKTRAESLAERLEKLSALDGLTGIANRRRFDQTLQREWSRALRSQKPLALVLGDIDYFKEYNDRYGHQAGDAALRQLAQLLERSARRGGDLAARYGGEEFTLLMPETTLSQAVKMADLVRESLQQLGVPHDASKAAHVLTASFGVTAMVPTEESSPAQLVKAADDALYAAKAQGRNIVLTSDGGTDGSCVLDSHSSIDR